MGRLKGRGGRRKCASVAAARPAEKNRQFLRIQIKGLPLVVPEKSGVRKGETSNGEIHETCQALLQRTRRRTVRGGGLLVRSGQVGDTMRIRAEMHLEIVDVQVAQANSPAEELPGIQTCFQVTRRNQRRTAGSFRAMNHQPLQGDLKEPGSKAESRDFHAATRKILEAREDAALQHSLEPGGAHRNQRYQC